MLGLIHRGGYLRLNPRRALDWRFAGASGREQSARTSPSLDPPGRNESPHGGRRPAEIGRTDRCMEPRKKKHMMIDHPVHSKQVAVWATGHCSYNTSSFHEFPASRMPKTAKKSLSTILLQGYRSKHHGQKHRHFEISKSLSNRPPLSASVPEKE